MSTGENAQALRKILDFTRLSAIIILLLHFYFYCYKAFQLWGYRTGLSDKLLRNISHSGLFKHLNDSKWLAFALLVISLMGSSGRKEETIKTRYVITYLLLGITLFFASCYLLRIQGSAPMVAVTYMVTTTVGFLLILSGGSLLSRLIRLKLNGD